MARAAPAIVPVEPRLLVACARLHLRPEDRDEIVAALREPLDWARLLGLARWHGLRPLLHRHLCAAAPSLVPRPVLVELWAESESIARHNRALVRELARLGTLFDGMGIRALHYKGPTLAVAAYGDLALREFGDLDILMSPGDVLAAKRALCAAGYAPVHDLSPGIEAALLETHAQYHLGLRSRSDGLVVELHWKTDAEAPIERMDAPAWWDGTGRAMVEGVEVRTFAPEDLLLVLCVHGAKHHWTCLGWLADVAELLRRGAELDWDRIERRAREAGCRRRVGTGLELARALLGAPLAPQGLAMANQPQAVRLARRFAHRLLALEPAEPSPAQALGLNLALHERAGARVQVVLDTVFLPNMAEWTRWPLPRELFFAYPALRIARLAAKYLRKGFGCVLRRGKLQT